MNEKKRQKRGMSQSFHNIKDLPEKRDFCNSSTYAAPRVSHNHEKLLNKTAILASTKSDDLKEDEPSSVNDKLPSRFVIDYPNFLKPAKYHPYRRLEEHHISDVLEQARKRHEDSLLK